MRKTRDSHTRRARAEWSRPRPGRRGRGRYRGGDEVDGWERPLLRATRTIWTTTTGMNSRGDSRRGDEGGVIVDDVDDAADDDDAAACRRRRRRCIRLGRLATRSIPSSGRVRASRPLPSRGRASPRRFGSNQPPPPDDRRPSRVAAWATWRSPAAVATWLAIACERARARALQTDASDAGAFDATDPDFPDYDPGRRRRRGRFQVRRRQRAGVGRDPRALAVQALHAWCAWARDARAPRVVQGRNSRGGSRIGWTVCRRPATGAAASLRARGGPGDVLRIRAGDVVPADAKCSSPGTGVPTPGTGVPARIPPDPGRRAGRGADGVPRRRSRTRSAGGSSRAASAAASGSRRGRRRSPASASGTATGATAAEILPDALPGRSRSSAVAETSGSLLLCATSAFVCVAMFAVLYARDTYEDAAGHGTDGGFFGALAIASALFAGRDVAGARPRRRRPDAIYRVVPREAGDRRARRWGCRWGCRRGCRPEAGGDGCRSPTRKSRGRSERRATARCFTSRRRA